MFKLKNNVRVAELSVSTYLSRWTDSRSEIAGSVRKQRSESLTERFQLSLVQLFCTNVGAVWLPVSFCGFSMGRNQYWAERVYGPSRL